MSVYNKYFQPFSLYQALILQDLKFATPVFLPPSTFKVYDTALMFLFGF